MTVMKDEIFMICKLNDEDCHINVVDCSNVAEVKDVIPLPGIYPKNIIGCNVSNCVYVHNKDEDKSIPDSVLRITKVQEHQFALSPWITTDQRLSLVTVSANGNLITISRHLTPNPAV